MELDFFIIALGIIWLMIYLAPFLWAQFLPDKTEAEVVQSAEMYNPNYRTRSFMPYIHYSVLRFEVDGDAHEVLMRRNKRDKVGEKVPVSYSQKYGVLLRRHWPRWYLWDKITWDFNFAFYLLSYGVMFGGMLLLMGLVALYFVINTPEYHLSTILFAIATAVLASAIICTYITMNQKNFNIERIFEPGQGTDNLNIYKRTIFEVKWCLYFLVGGIFWVVIFLVLGAAYPELRTPGSNIYWLTVTGFGGLLLLIVLCAKWQVESKNHLLKTGEIVWATIDKSETYWEKGVFHVSCFWFSKEDGKTYSFYKSYPDATDNIRFDYRTKILQEPTLAVVIKKGHPEKYEILLREHIFSYLGNGWLRPVTCTKLLRTVQKEK